MLRQTNHGTKLLDERLFDDKGKLWDKSINMNERLKKDFGLVKHKKCYIDYLDHVVVFTTPRPSTNKALHVKPKLPSLAQHNFLSNRQKEVYSHIQGDSLYLDTFELEIAVLRSTPEEPLVTRRIMSEGDPAHISLRSQIGQLKCWPSTSSVSRDRFSAPRGKSIVGIPKRYTVVNRPWHRIKMCQIAYELQRNSDEQKLAFYKVPDYICGDKIDPVVQRFKNFTGSPDDKKKLEDRMRRTQDIGGDPELDMEVVWMNGDPIAKPQSADMAKKWRDYVREDDLFDLIPLHSSVKVAYFAGRNLEDMENRPPSQVGFWTANANKLLRVKDCLADSDDSLADINLDNTRVLGPERTYSMIELVQPKAKVNGQSYYSPENLFPLLSREDNFFVRPSNTLQLWDRLVKNEDIQDIADGDPNRYDFVI